MSNDEPAPRRAAGQTREDAKAPPAKLKTLKDFSPLAAHGLIRALFSGICSPIGGARRDRTDDLMLAKHALSQLSYGPVGGRRSDIRRPTMPVVRLAYPSFPNLVGLGGLEPPTSRLSSARSNQLSYKPGSLEHKAGAKTTERGLVSAIGRPSSEKKEERRRRRGPAKRGSLTLSRLI